MQALAFSTAACGGVVDSTGNDALDPGGRAGEVTSDVGVAYLSAGHGGASGADASIADSGSLNPLTADASAPRVDASGGGAPPVTGEFAAYAIESAFLEACPCWHDAPCAIQDFDGYDGSCFSDFIDRHASEQDGVAECMVRFLDGLQRCIVENPCEAQCGRTHLLDDNPLTEILSEECHEVWSASIADELSECEP